MLRQIWGHGRELNCLRPSEGIHGVDAACELFINQTRAIIGACIGGTIVRNCSISRTSCIDEVRGYKKCGFYWSDGALCRRDGWSEEQEW